jgi:hypothetical protein
MQAKTKRKDGNHRVMEDVLYGLCHDHPDHTDPSSVYSKLWLIGRGYATGIERAIKSNQKMGGSMTALAKAMLKNGRQLNKLFAELKSVSEPLTVSKARKIVSLHGRFIELIRKPLRPDVSPHSFASKYMHFHCRAVPLVDRFASRKLTELVPWKQVEPAVQFPMPHGADSAYGWFVMRFLSLYEQKRKKNPDITVKEMDEFLTAE